MVQRPDIRNRKLGAHIFKQKQEAKRGRPGSRVTPKDKSCVCSRQKLVCICVEREIKVGSRLRYRQESNLKGGRG